MQQILIDQYTIWIPDKESAITPESNGSKELICDMSWNLNQMNQSLNAISDWFSDSWQFESNDEYNNCWFTNYDI